MFCFFCCAEGEGGQAGHSFWRIFEFEFVQPRCLSKQSWKMVKPNEIRYI